MLRTVALGALAVGAAAVVTLLLIAKLLLAPRPGEWATTLYLGPLRFEAGVPTLLRLATSAWFAPWLDGHGVNTPYGPVRLGWEASSRTLALRCAPCAAVIPAFGMEPLAVDQLTLRVQHDAERLGGTIEARATSANPSAAALAPRLIATWKGKLDRQSLALAIDLPETSIAVAYAVLAAQLPELGRARIRGTLALQARIDLPSGQLKLHPVVTGFQVSDLGSEAMAHEWQSQNRCGAPVDFAANGWLARAVIAAEDQRFFGHHGYDPEELAASLARNQAEGAVARGGSTIPQQLAKLMVVGGERSAGRKLRELLYAVEMEETLGKPRILQLYLNHAPWGAGICGGDAAARRYFDRPATRLEPAQAVWLAAMLHNPDMELARWSQSGRVDIARAQWIADGVRGVPGVGRAQRDALKKSLANQPLRMAGTPFIRVAKEARQP
ncbi:MAG: biosynthetic peptidoglycan transglycosylase [Variovorax sp.]